MSWKNWVEKRETWEVDGAVQWLKNWTRQIPIVLLSSKRGGFNYIRGSSYLLNYYWNSIKSLFMREIISTVNKRGATPCGPSLWWDRGEQLITCAWQRSSLSCVILILSPPSACDGLRKGPQSGSWMRNNWARPWRSNGTLHPSWRIGTIYQRWLRPRACHYWTAIDQSTGTGSAGGPGGSDGQDSGYCAGGASRAHRRHPWYRHPSWPATTTTTPAIRTVTGGSLTAYWW